MKGVVKGWTKGKCDASNLIGLGDQLFQVGCYDEVETMANQFAEMSHDDVDGSRTRPTTCWHCSIAQQQHRGHRPAKK